MKSLYPNILCHVTIFYNWDRAIESPVSILGIQIHVYATISRFMVASWLTDYVLDQKSMPHCSDVIMGAVASQITSLAFVYSTVYSGAAQRKHQSPESLTFVRGNHHRRPVNSPHSNAENVSIWWRHHAVSYQPGQGWNVLGRLKNAYGLLNMIALEFSGSNVYWESHLSIYG